jgi:hypothetical protein
VEVNVLIPDELRKSEGRLVNKFKRPEWARPDRVELVSDGELHIWRLRESNERLRFVSPPSDLLERFLDLSTASGPQLCRFAQKYGHLGIFQREHPSNQNFDDPWCEVELGEVWRYFARVMNAMLRVTSSVYSNSSGAPKDWGLIMGNCPQSIELHVDRRHRSEYARLSGITLSRQTPEEWWPWYVNKSTDPIDEHELPPATPGAARTQLALRMNLLLGLGEIHPYFIWPSLNQQPQVIHAGYSLLSYLVLELSNKMAKIDGHAFCDHCGKVYEPERAPRTDRRNFCPNCHDEGIPQRLADRKRREKERSRNRRS